MKKIQAGSKVKNNNLKRFILPGAIVLIVVIAGSYFLSSSHAETANYSQFLNYQSAEKTAGVVNIQAQIDSIGEQTVSDVSPNAQLSYAVGGKVAIKRECYYIQVLPLKGGGLTAAVELTGQGNSTKLNITYDPSKASSYQRICVNSGNHPIKAYNVINLSPSSGPDVLIYQDELVM